MCVCIYVYITADDAHIYVQTCVCVSTFDEVLLSHIVSLLGKQVTLNANYKMHARRSKIRFRFILVCRNEARERERCSRGTIDIMATRCSSRPTRGRKQQLLSNVFGGWQLDNSVSRNGWDGEEKKVSKSVIHIFITC